MLRILYCTKINKTSKQKAIHFVVHETKTFTFIHMVLFQGQNGAPYNNKKTSFSDIQVFKIVFKIFNNV